MLIKTILLKFIYCCKIGVDTLYFEIENFDGLPFGLGQRDFSVMLSSIETIQANGESPLNFLTNSNHKLHIIFSMETR